MLQILNEKKVIEQKVGGIMNKLTIILSFLTFAWLSVDLFATGDNDETVVSDKMASKFYPPLSVVESLLAIEEHWMKLQKEDEEAQAEKLARNNKSLEPEVDKSKLLLIGDDSYQLLGIFVTQSTPFILVKLLSKTSDQNSIKNTPSARSSGIIKVLKGQEMSPGITLTELTSSKIILQGKDETFEFKLFERSSNDKS